VLARPRRRHGNPLPRPPGGSAGRWCQRNAPEAVFCTGRPSCRERPGRGEMTPVRYENAHRPDTTLAHFALPGPLTSGAGEGLERAEDPARAATEARWAALRPPRAASPGSALRWPHR
jgi:hypothetical protein